MTTTSPVLGGYHLQPILLKIKVPFEVSEAGVALDVLPIGFQYNRTERSHHGGEHDKCLSDAFEVSTHPSVFYSPHILLLPTPLPTVSTPSFQVAGKWNGFQGVSSPPPPQSLGTVSPSLSLFNLHLSPTTKPPFTRSGKASPCLMTLASRREQEIVLGRPIFQLTTYSLHTTKLATTLIR